MLVKNKHVKSGSENVYGNCKNKVKIKMIVYHIKNWSFYYLKHLIDIFKIFEIDGGSRFTLRYLIMHLWMLQTHTTRLSSGKCGFAIENVMDNWKMEWTFFLPIKKKSCSL